MTRVVGLARGAREPALSRCPVPRGWPMALEALDGAELDTFVEGARNRSELSARRGSPQTLSPGSQALCPFSRPLTFVGAAGAWRLPLST